MEQCLRLRLIMLPVGGSDPDRGLPESEKPGRQVMTKGISGNRFSAFGRGPCARGPRGGIMSRLIGTATVTGIDPQAWRADVIAGTSDMPDVA